MKRWLIVATTTAPGSDGSLARCPDFGAVTVAGFVTGFLGPNRCLVLVAGTLSELIALAQETGTLLIGDDGRTPAIVAALIAAAINHGILDWTPRGFDLA